MRKIINSTNTNNQRTTNPARQSAVWEYHGFKIYKTQGYWFYHKIDDSDCDQYEIAGEPADTLTEAKRVIDHYFSK